MLLLLLLLGQFYSAKGPKKSDCMQVCVFASPDLAKVTNVGGTGTRQLKLF